MALRTLGSAAASFLVGMMTPMMGGAMGFMAWRAA